MLPSTDVLILVTRHLQILVYRICREGSQHIQLIQRIEDEDVSSYATSLCSGVLATSSPPRILTADQKDACNSSLAWSKDLDTGAPLICVAGGNAKIKIRDARTGTLQVVC